MNSSASRLDLTNALLMAVSPSLKDADTVSCSGVASAVAGRTLQPFSPELTSVAVTLLSPGTSAIFDLLPYLFSHIKFLFLAQRNTQKHQIVIT
nr:hypothetical protein Itr_chr12CG16680 [Ipomoea trifida]